MLCVFTLHCRRVLHSLVQAVRDMTGSATAAQRLFVVMHVHEHQLQALVDDLMVHKCFGLNRERVLLMVAQRQKGYCLDSASGVCVCVVVVVVTEWVNVWWQSGGKMTPLVTQRQGHNDTKAQGYKGKKTSIPIGNKDTAKKCTRLQNNPGLPWWKFPNPLFRQRAICIIDVHNAGLFLPPDAGAANANSPSGNGAHAPRGAGYCMAQLAWAGEALMIGASGKLE
eukprot:scaffold20049_cov20-Tisochrysis_lutea.AAC.2